jgi:hypothetical protein
MILKYKDYLLESLLLESELILSDDFIDLLKSMKSSKIRDFLLINLSKNDKQLSLFTNDLNLKYNYLDISKTNNDEVTFTLDKKAKEITGDIWDSNRNPIKIGRVINSIIKSNDLNISPKEIEDFINLYKSSIDKKNNQFYYFDIVKGEDIKAYYKKENYKEVKGETNLIKSCMNEMDSNIFNMYSNNPDVCSLVILYSDDDRDIIKGRALLWKTTSREMVLDRIYTHYDSDIKLFQEYAEQNNWFYKETPKGTIRFILNGDLKTKIFQVEVEGSYNYYPYLDTFKYYNGAYRFLTNREPRASDYENEEEFLDEEWICLDSDEGEFSEVYI